MICNNCGTELPENATFCTQCGNEQAAQSTGLPLIIEGIDSIFSSKLFFALSILMTVAAATSFLSGSVDILLILSTIAMWMAFNAAKNRNIMGYASPLKFLSGIAKAQVILMWVVVGIFAIVSLIFFIGGSAILNYATLNFNGTLYNLEDILGDYGVIAQAMAGAFGIIFLFAAVIVALINIFIHSNIYKFAHSVSATFSVGQNLIVKLGFVKIVMLIFGILSAINGLFFVGNLYSIVSSGTGAASEIIIFVILDRFEKNYLSKC